MMAPGGEDMVDQLMGKVEQLKVRGVGCVGKQVAGMVERTRWASKQASNQWWSGRGGWSVGTGQLMGKVEQRLARRGGLAVAGQCPPWSGLLCHLTMQPRQLD